MTNLDLPWRQRSGVLSRPLAEQSGVLICTACWKNAVQNSTWQSLEAEFDAMYTTHFTGA